MQSNVTLLKVLGSGEMSPACSKLARAKEQGLSSGTEKETKRLKEPERERKKMRERQRIGGLKERGLSNWE